MVWYSVSTVRVQYYYSANTFHTIFSAVGARMASRGVMQPHTKPCVCST